MDVSRWGHKNRFLLISLVPAGGEYGDIEQEGSYQATATLWVLAITAALSVRDTAVLPST